MGTVEPSAQKGSHEELLSIKMEIVLGGKTNKIITEHLPIDLVIDILCQLPIKNLTVFKCVCKSWNRLISHVCIPRISADFCVLNLYRGDLFQCYDARCYSDKMPELNYCGPIPKDRDNKTCYHEIDCCHGLSLYMAKYICRYIVVSRATNQFQCYSHLIYMDCRYIWPNIFVLHCYYPGYYKGIKWARKTVYLDGMLYLLTLEKHLVLFDLKSSVVSAEVIEVPCQTRTSRTGVIGQCRGVLYYVNYNKDCRLSMWQFDYPNTSGTLWYSLFLGLKGRIYSYHLESRKCELVWRTENCLGWRNDFVYYFSYSYVNVKDFRMEDHEYLSLTKSTRDLKLENVSDDCTTVKYGVTGKVSV
ncbi:hypothetical protein MKX03_003165 [Papaver bracteatum]|nr:hypothetical protein MKX03_003165 [Papaver bracteatum]